MTLAPHETLELHELIRSEVVCVKKLQASMAMVQDQELSSFMHDSVKAKATALTELEQLYFKGQHNRLQQ
jgi:similar to spore coat protein